MNKHHPQELYGKCFFLKIQKSIYNFSKLPKILISKQINLSNREELEKFRTEKGFDLKVLEGKILKPIKIQTLANKLYIELVNKSFPGSSNIEVLYSILKFDFKQDDVAVIMWSHYVRDMLFNNQHKFPLFRDRLGPWKKTHQERKWVEFLD